MATQSGAEPRKPGDDVPFRVMVVDDSVVIRGLLSRALETDPEVRVVSSVGDGQMAVNAIRRQPIDVVVLDIEMPVMDGLTALPKLLEASPHTKVVMASTLTKRNADISLRAMSSGASDYVPKPTSMRDAGAADEFKRELLSKVKALAAAARRSGGDKLRAAYEARPLRDRDAPLAPRSGAAPALPGKPPAKIILRPFPTAFRPEVIAIGSSTGGPQALFEVVGHLSQGITQPILITQHMPATFTTILAEHISRQCKLKAVEAQDGMPLVGGEAYVAPGNYHMTVQSKDGRLTIKLNQDPPENFCRPSVDPMMRSLAALLPRKVLSVILTGMGADGLKGCEKVVASGSAVIAQDEATSVVWGMPGAVATAGLCSAVLPVKEIGPSVRRMALRGAA